MKRLVKILAVLVLAVIVTATIHTVVETNAANPPPSIDGYNSICVNNTCSPSGRTTPAASDPDINVVLRQFVSVPGFKGIFNFVHPTNAAPALCNLFGDKRTPGFTSLYGVGIRGGVDNTHQLEADPPHMAGFLTNPGETIYTPPLPAKYGAGGIGGGYSAMVLYADDNSITLKYTHDDNVVYGYTIHILGIAVNSDLLTLYSHANRDGRWYLPALKPGQPIGTAKGTEIWVIIRDTGQFMDPRWSNDWWVGCPSQAQNVDSTFKPSNPPGYTTTAATPISQDQQATENIPLFEGKYQAPNFPPLGSLEACPPQISTNGEINQEAPPVPTGVGGACKPETLPEPAPCQDPSLIGKSKEWSVDNWCRRGGAKIRFCYPESKDIYVNKGSFDCDGGKTALRDYARDIKGFCLGDQDIIGTQGGAYDIYKAIAAAWREIQSGVCVPPTVMAPNDQDLFRYCMGYFESTNHAVPQGVIERAAGLPACVPTYNQNANCVSECSDPITVTESLRMFADNGCLRNGECLSKIGITDKKFAIPFAQKLGDYFAGVLDAENLSTADLDRMQNILRKGATDPRQSVQEVFNAAGVSRKLLPADIQDQLRCNFINYVVEKKNLGLNTKYYDRVNKREFEVYGTPVTQIPCKPHMSDPNYTNWVNKWGQIWFAVPLFPNDEAQGEIQFVSPSLFSTQELGADKNYPKTRVGPIYVSIPEVQRVSSATAVIQRALIPEVNIEQKEQLINSLAYPVTVGKAITPFTQDPSCKQTPGWEQYYSKTSGSAKDELSYDLSTLDNQPQLSEFDRGVTCGIPNKLGTPDSQVCVIGPEGQIRCYQQEPGSAPPAGIVKNYKETVQVRTVFPYLFDIAEQTIAPTTGLLRIFKPENINILNTLNNAVPNPNIPSQTIFDKNYEPIPASIDNVQYQISDKDIQIDKSNNPNGWKIFFYKLGGLVNAKDFVLKLLYPPVKSGSTP